MRSGFLEKGGFGFDVKYFTIRRRAFVPLFIVFLGKTDKRIWKNMEDGGRLVEKKRGLPV